MRHLSRSAAIKIAAVISFALGGNGFISALPYISLGADAINQVVDGPPFGVIFWAFIFAIVRMLAAYGTWHNQRGSIIVTLLASAGDALLAAPGMLFAPTANMQASSAIGTLLCILVIILSLWRDHKPMPPT